MNSGRGKNDNQVNTLVLAIALLIFVLYLLAYLCTIVMAQQDVLIATKRGLYLAGGSGGGSGSGSGSGSSDSSSDDAWIDVALADEDFVDGLSTWKALNRSRFIFSVLSWIGCCVLLSLDLAKMNLRGEELVRGRHTTLAWVRRVRQMEGSSNGGLEHLRLNELKKLVSILEVGLSRTQEALAYEEMAAANRDGEGSSQQGGKF